MEEQQFVYDQSFELENGTTLEGFTLSYHTFGTINKKRDNVIWVCHALTGDSQVTDWWHGLFGEGKIFNPEEHFVICANVLGSCYGSTGPLSTNPKTGKPFYHDFPLVTIRDMVRSLILLKESLNITHINTLIGGSLGGQQALEWAIFEPKIIDNLIVIASNAFHSPWGIAFNESQRMAISADPSWKESHPDAGKSGLAAARSIAMLSYRNYQTYQNTQSEEDINKLDDFKASSYQRYQGEKLTKRFDAYSYWALSKAMDCHNVGRNRNSVEEALNKIEAYTLVLGVATDILFPINEQRFIARHIQNVTYEEFSSTYGHDGFLVEVQKLEESFKAFFKQKNRKQILNG